MALDVVTEVELFVDVFIGVYTLAILAYILTSWVQLPYSLRPIQRFRSFLLLSGMESSLSETCPSFLWRTVSSARSARTSFRRLL